MSCDAFGRSCPRPAADQQGRGPAHRGAEGRADGTCRRTGELRAGEPATTRSSDQAVRGNLWWSESNWRNRITVLLTFAPTAEVCPAESEEKPLELMGSVVLNELTASWRPKFCTTDTLFSFTHVQQASPWPAACSSAARSPARSARPRSRVAERPVVQAPVALGGFGIAFSIDDADHKRREQLQLNARLVAKLLSASHPATPRSCTGHAGLEENPYNLTVDPEFKALNPGIAEASTMESAPRCRSSSNSDLVWALSQWIDADPEARAWLDGKPDPWG